MNEHANYTQSRTKSLWKLRSQKGLNGAAGNQEWLMSDGEVKILARYIIVAFYGICKNSNLKISRVNISGKYALLAFYGRFSFG